ncbi:MAG: hypothetical protein FJX23_01650 [Alphaproteobacteria bacterium]|nr:hypothetical protein [Alphaproteobacteria bacterium]
MTVSLMSMLGGRVNLSAGASEKEDAGKVELQSNGGDAAFETIMAASEQKEISAAELRAFFASRGIEVDVVQQAAGGIDFAALNGQMQKLPSDVAVVVQEFLTGATSLVSADVEGEVAVDPEAALQDLISQLPARELTAEELSEIVQATGIEPAVIFDALRNTPAASPNLAAAMVDDMGDAAADAGLPLPKPVLATGESADASGDEAASAQKAAQVPVLTAAQQQVIEKIVNVLQGASDQAEFPGEWLSRLAALSAAKQGAEKTTEKNAPVILTSIPAADAETVLPLQVAAAPAVKVVNDNQPQQPAAKPTKSDKHAKVEASTTQPVTAEVAPRAAVVEGEAQLDATTTLTTKPATDAATLTVVADNGAAKPAAPLSDAAKIAAPAPQSTPDESPAEQIAVRFRQVSTTGDASIQIKLKPLELGSVDVRIETGADGQSRVHVTAEKRDTLDMLQRDARALERALNDIGFKTDNSSLSFNLRGDQNQQNANGYSNGDEQGKGKFSLDGGYAEDEIHDDLPAAYDVSKAYSLTLNRGVDISV